MITPESVLTYGNLVDSVRCFCGVLDAQSIVSGDRVVIHCADDGMACVSFIACLLDGKVPVLLGSDCGEARRRSVIEYVQAVLLITDAAIGNECVTTAHPGGISLTGLRTDIACPERKLALLEAAPSKGSLLARLARKAGAGTSDSTMSLIGTDDAQREPVLPADPNELAYLLFTSGTTSAPSGVRILRRNLFEHLHTLTQLFSYDEKSRVFNATPLAHTDGLVHGLLIAAINGATFLNAPPLSIGELEGWLERLRSWRATHFVTNPTAFGIIDRYAAHDDYVDHTGFSALYRQLPILAPLNGNALSND